jgi:hypothetical protein
MLSPNAQKLLTILKQDYSNNGKINLPPASELMEKMGFAAMPPLVSCLKRLFEAGELIEV